MPVRQYIGSMVLTTVVFFLCVSPPLFAASLSPEEVSKQEIEVFLNELFRERSNHLVHPNHAMDTYYDTNSKGGRQALAIQNNRAAYLHAWADKRHMVISDSQSSLRIRGIKKQGDQVKLTLGHSQKITYAYQDTPSLKQSFGLGTWHVMALSKKENSWKVSKEWFLDPLEENPKKIPEGVPSLPSSPRSVSKGKRYDRERAVAYAHKYAGLAWGAGNEGKYNGKYKNYNHLGGDCTNFASQVLGDPEEGGGLNMRGPWRYHYRSGGTRTWVQTDAFKRFLVHSGYGQRVALGHFEDLVKPTYRHPHSPLSELASGDLIAHVMHNDVDHFSIVTGFDHHGYPLVNSHTADRYKAPFDLGWDDQTQYLLIHIKD
ncbi:amidase domain-containing protein [Paenibacillus sp. 2TAF8]|uniref:amidase domain-containing protein n=1 Tax=Paenibacillus sp. 2TAF8 TaxID=3233020 RepID=UPI003F9E6AF2